MGKWDDFWLDDPEWELLRRKAEKRPISKELKKKAGAGRPESRSKREVPRAAANREDTEKEVVVNLKLAIPKIKLPDFKKLFKVFYETHKKRVNIWAGVSLLVITAIVSFNLISARRAAEQANQPQNPQEQAHDAFNPLIPLENLTDASGKQSKPEFRFDGERKVFAYVVEYNAAELTVSQQSLPEQLKTHPGQIEGIARSINAFIPIDTQKGRAFLTSIDEDAEEVTYEQIAVFATDEVLVFIKSSKELDEEDWKFYINQLNPSK